MDDISAPCVHVITITPLRRHISTGKHTNHSMIRDFKHLLAWPVFKLYRKGRCGVEIALLSQKVNMHNIPPHQNMVAQSRFRLTGLKKLKQEILVPAGEQPAVNSYGQMRKKKTGWNNTV